jgi:hypothetical protein
LVALQQAAHQRLAPRKPLNPKLKESTMNTVKSWFKTVQAKLPQVWKAVVAFASAVVAQEGVILAVAQSTGVVPAAWVHALVVAFGGVSGFLTWLKTNQPLVAGVVEAVSKTAP